MKPLPDPFTPSVAYEALTALLARRGLMACHRCGDVGLGAPPNPDCRATVRNGGWIPCLGCGALLVGVHAVGHSRDPTPDELERMRRRPSWLGVVDEHDRIVRRLCPND